MRKKLLLLLTGLFLVSCFTFAQQGERIVHTINLLPTTDRQIIEGELPFFNAPPFFSYFMEWPVGALKLNIRFSKDGSTWTGWKTMEREEHNPKKHITQLYFGESDYSRYQLEIVLLRQAVPFVKLHFFNPGESRVVNTIRPSLSADNALICPCPMPDFQGRSDWCPAGNCPEIAVPAITEVSHLIVHHSAGSNTSIDWAATVRAIWDFHVNGNGWDDIGYNWLIDPNGVLYQGRGDDVRGAHFCAQNSNTMGVCVLGNFTNTTPALAAVSSLEELLAWKSCDRDIAPLESSLHSSSGLVLPNIAGHRDGCNTACPGDSFHPLLPAVRQGVVDLIESDCAAVSTDDLWLADESVILSPNPAGDQISIQFTDNLKGRIQWQIVNLYQQTVLKGQANKIDLLYTDDISIRKLAAGIYFLHIDIKGKKGTWKIVKI